MSVAAAVDDGRRRETAILIGLVVAYVTLDVALALTGRFTFIAKTAVIPVLVLVALRLGRLAAFVSEWAVFVAAVILFDCCRGLVYALTLAFDLPIHATYAARADEALFGGTSLPVLLQARLFQPPVIGPFEKALTVVHGSHFLFFLLVGVAVWLLRREEFWRFRRAIMLLMAGGLAIYFAVPTVPPWMAARLHVIGPIRHITAEIYNVAVPTLQSTLDVNPVAAMPSLHTAFPALCAFIALHHFGRRAALLPVYALVMMFAIAYLGEHYLVDIVAGVALAAAVYVVVYRTDLLPAPAPPKPGRAPWVRSATIAMVLVALSEAVGQVSMHYRHHLLVDPAFVRREMVGRSDHVHLALGRWALRRGDVDGGARELRLALDELRDPAERAGVEAMLAHPRDVVLVGDDVP
ncbi:MAG TPA: phosphatase PAP2 family protein [Polyangia bacterium]|nr:phosphatase PAP2 family protein [Polyangia bacterium]